jgi:hypothetical protein
MAMAVVEVDAFWIRPVISNHQVQVLVAIEIRQGGCIAAIRLGTQRMALIEAALSIIQKNHIKQRPMTTFRQHDVEIAIAIKIADAGVRRGFGFVLEKHETLKGKSRLRCPGLSSLLWALTPREQEG